MSKVVNPCYLTFLSFSFTSKVALMENTTTSTPKTSSTQKIIPKKICVPKKIIKKTPAKITAQKPQIHDAPKLALKKVPAPKTRCARMSIKVAKKKVHATRNDQKDPPQNAPKTTIEKAPASIPIQSAPESIGKKVPAKRTAQITHKTNVIQVPPVMDGLNPFEIVMGTHDFFAYIQSFMMDESLYCKSFSFSKT